MFQIVVKLPHVCPAPGSPAISVDPIDTTLILPHTRATKKPRANQSGASCSSGHESAETEPTDVGNRPTRFKHPVHVGDRSSEGADP